MILHKKKNITAYYLLHLQYIRLQILLVALSLQIVFIYLKMKSRPSQDYQTKF